jgi:hypothetical protein
MDEIKTPSKSEELEIYAARLTFRRTIEGRRTIKGPKKDVTVHIRFSKRRKGKWTLPFPEDIDENGLPWFRYRGQDLVEYHRKHRKDKKDGHLYIEYIDTNNETVHTALHQKLEMLVRGVITKSII